MKTFWVQGNSEMYFCVCPPLQVSILVEFKSILFYAYPVWSYNSYLIDLRLPSSCINKLLRVLSVGLSKRYWRERWLRPAPESSLSAIEIFLHPPSLPPGLASSLGCCQDSSYVFLYHLFLVVLFLLHGSFCNQLFFSVGCVCSESEKFCVRTVKIQLSRRRMNQHLWESFALF